MKVDSAIPRSAFPEEGSGTMDAGDFSILLRRHGDRVYNFAYRLAGNAADASDLVQEAWVRAFAARLRYDPAQAFDTWVMSILHHLFIDGRRRYEKRHVVSLDAPILEERGREWSDLLPGKDPDPCSIAVGHEAGDLAQRALSVLAPDHRAVVVLCDVEGLTYEEAAAVVGCPVGTVRSRLHHGRTLLRRAFQQFGGTP